jgi:hypothetical protein
MPDIRRHVPTGFPRVVVWTRGDGCLEIAELLATDHAVRADSDVVTSCITNRADLVVTAARNSLETVTTVRPVDFDRTRVRSVVAAVSGGPHSKLAARVAARLGKSLGVPAEAVSGHRDQHDEGRALRALAAAEGITGISARSTKVKSAGDLIDSLGDGALLVLGAAGGSWLQRQFFGPGVRLTRRASGGTIVVRSAPVRAYQCMEDLDAFGPHLRAADAVRLSSASVEPIVEAGKLIGVVRRSEMLACDADTEIGTLAEPAPHAAATDAVDELIGLDSFFEGAPVPVVDREGNLVGGLRLDDV